MDHNEKYTESDIRINEENKSELQKKLENFWFYHKIHVIVAVFIVMVLSVCIAQSCSKKNEDITVMYAGPHLFTPEEVEVVREELNAVMPSDFDGNGEKYTGIVTYRIMSEDEIKALEEEYKNSDDFVIVDKSFFSTQFQTYNQYMLTGECGVFLLSPYLYESLITIENNRLCKLSEVFETVPESAVGEYGIKLSETPLYKNSEVLSKLPEDTMLCLTKPFVFGKSSNEKYYQRMVSMFIAMSRD